MKKLEYFKQAITQSKLYNEKKWLLSVFAITMPSNLEGWESKAYRFQILKSYTGLSYVDVDSEGMFVLVTIDDYVKGEPLFRISDVIELDSSWCSNITEPLTTKIGNLLINKICVEPSFGKKYPFQNGRLSVGTFEEYIAPKLRDTTDKKSDEFIYVDEFLEFADRLYFLTNLADIINITGTPTNLSTPPNFAAQKAEIFKKYKDNISDPIVLAAFERELMTIDAAHLKGDPTDGVFISGKIKDTARKKMHISFGAEREFEDSNEVKPILNSLEEGLDTNEDAFVSYMNGMRSGSYSRGAETVKGGVVSKTLLRSLGGLTVTDIDCGTKIGLVRHITKSNYLKLVGRNVRSGNSWVMIENPEQAATLIEKRVEMRSAMYCKASTGNYCSHCLSTAYTNNPNAIAITGLEVSAVILGSFMKMMHSQALKTGRVEITDMCS